MNSLPLKLIQVRNPPAWSPVQAWAYALGAPYHVLHKVPLNALPEPIRSSGATNPLRAMLKTHGIKVLEAGGSDAASPLQAMLKDGWNVECEEDLLRVLNWLGAQGHRQQHRLELRRYSIWRRPSIAARREELRDAGRQDSDALEALWRLDAIQADTDGIRGADLIGFDAARAVMVARSGCLLGWLSEERMWNYILDVARDVQRRFSSWAEYATDFQRSRNLWRGTNARDAFDLSLELLLNTRSSPWRTLPWPAAGLEIPRPVRPFDPAAPVWPLECSDVAF